MGRTMRDFFNLCMILNNKHIFNVVSCSLHESHEYLKCWVKVPKVLNNGLRRTFVATNCLFNNFVDINECTKLPSLCHENANCTNANGSYSCQCLTGYSGDGNVDCTGIVLLCNYFIIVCPSLIFKKIIAWEGQCMIFYLCMILNKETKYITSWIFKWLLWDSELGWRI